MADESEQETGESTATDTAAAQTADRNSEFMSGFDIEDDDDKETDHVRSVKKVEKESKPDADDKAGDGSDADKRDADKKDAVSEESGDLEKLAEKKGFSERKRDETGKFVKSVESDSVSAKDEQASAPVSPMTFDMNGITLPDGEIDIGGKTVNLKTFAADFPEVAVLVEKMADAKIQAALEKAGFAKSEETQKAINSLSERAFWSDVSEEVPKAKATYNSKEFAGWLEKQSPGIRKMAAESGDPSDMVHLLNSFKSSQKSTTRKADLMAGNLQNKPRESARATKEARDEFMDGFNLPD